MSNAQPISDQVAALVDRVVQSYHVDRRTQHLDSQFLPSRKKTIEIVELLRRVMFPGFFDETRLTSATVRYHVGELLRIIHALLHDQIRQALRHENERQVQNGERLSDEACDQEAVRITEVFLNRIPELRRLLSLDVQAAFDGDPAAQSTNEIIFCYPGLDAIFIQRIAHELYELKVPLLPRIMGEYAHNWTGIDIHPGASIGESFFIDHGSGVVVGETTTIGNRVKLYQGVTLGALSTKGGQTWRGRKRHPTIEDDVTIYGNAIILGGNVTIGKGCVIGGSVFLTQSVPENHMVKMKLGELEITPRRPPKPGAKSGDSDEFGTGDFQI